MKLETLLIGDIQIAEVLSDTEVIASAEDGLNLMGDLYYQGFDRIILYEKSIIPAFFDLRNGMAGEVLQKFSTYRVKLAIVGNFGDVASKSLQDFIRESNKMGHVSFVSSREEAVTSLSK